MGPTLFPNANYDFISKRNVLLAVATGLVGISLASIFTNGLNLSVEFTGGAQLEVDFDETKQHKADVSIESVRAALDEAGIENAQVVTIGGANDHAFLVRVQALQSVGASLGSKIEGVLRAKYGEEKLQYFDFDRESLDRASVRFAPDAKVTGAELKALLSSAPELGGLGIEEVLADSKESNSFIIRLENAANDALTAITQKFGNGYASSIDSIGAAVSKDLQKSAFQAILLACVLIAAYVWLRFDWDFAPGVILALIHDSIVLVGVWSICGKTLGLQGFEFNLTIVAAVLAILGYSVNDTVVIYDRIRENREKHQGKDILWVVNRSVNETLSRTVLTSGATLLSVLSIALLGSESIRWFGWAMAVGMVSGIWSTVAVAIPTTMWVYTLRERAAAREAAAGVRAKG